MKIHDQHVHSYYSFDSQQPIEEYLNKAIELSLDYFVLTDHCDLNYLGQGKDLYFNLKMQSEELNNLQSRFPSIKILRGIEIGYKPSEMKKINDIVKNNHFDLINFSLHESDGIDYYLIEEFKKHGIQETLNLYFSKVLEAIQSFNDFDVLCHFDYGFKTAYLINNSLSIETYKEQITKIMKLIIKNKKALEINVKVQKYLPVAHTRYILGLYKSLGGKYLTISSDAHQLKTYYENFDKYIKIIKEEGFKELTYFVNRDVNLLRIS